MWGHNFWVWGLVSEVGGLGSCTWVPAYGVHGLGSGSEVKDLESGGPGSEVKDLESGGQGLRSRIWGSGSEVKDIESGVRVPGVKYEI